MGRGGIGGGVAPPTLHNNDRRRDWSADKIAGELGDVILDRIPARVRAGETVIFESVGMPLLDTTATAWAYRSAREHQLGTKFSLD